MLKFLLINSKFLELKSLEGTTYIFGHKNPDTDSIISAIVMADYEKEIGNPNYIQPCRLGNLNKETKYILNYFEVNPPELITESSLASEVILVDHNSYLQSADDLKKSNIVKVIDHHALAGLETVDPIYIITKPVGSTCTIIYQLYKEKKISIKKQIAGLMLSAIISDTILLKNSITTSEDISAVKELAELAEINYEDFGYKILLVGTDVSDLSEKEIINMDTKQYKANNYLIQLSWLNSVDIKAVTNRKKKILEEMNNEINKKKIDLYVLCILDIMNMNSNAIVAGTLSTAVEEAFNNFNAKIKDNEIFLAGVSARKKDLYPPIAEVVNKYQPKSNSSVLKLNLLFILSCLAFVLC